MDMNEVTEWYEQEQWDNSDKDNLRMSSKFIWDSVLNIKFGRESYLQSKIMKLGP